jgi:hypothetical protein
MPVIIIVGLLADEQHDTLNHKAQPNMRRTN